METLTERMDNLLEKILYCDLRNNIGIDKTKDLIRKAFKNEQKITRHACAESVRNVDPHKLHGCMVSGQDVRDMNRHEELMVSEIMNTKSV